MSYNSRTIEDIAILPKIKQLSKFVEVAIDLASFGDWQREHPAHRPPKLVLSSFGGYTVRYWPYKAFWEVLVAQ